MQILKSVGIPVIALGSLLSAFLHAEHLRLNPVNPHYFEFRGKPTILITSGEHYGAVINGEFDYKKYLATLKADGLNLTRTFTNYRELPGAFGISHNSLAARQEYYLSPWARSDTPGYLDGGNKFDLKRWDEKYFARLKDFVAEAGRQGVIVEINVFSTYYDDKSWSASPMNARNNINGIGAVPHNEPLTLQHKQLVEVEDDYVKKLVLELKDFDNLYLEICNEPYFGGPTLEWQRHVAEVITNAERELPFKHLISQNIGNGSEKIANPNPRVSIFNFHYCTPPDAVALNYDLKRVIGDNETGFRGTNDSAYRQEAWDFIIAGGALYNNLDYSFTVGTEDGTYVFPKTQPGGGTPALRKQLGALSRFVNGFDFIEMKPGNAIFKESLPPGVSGRALAQEGTAYAIYLRPIAVPAQFSARWTGLIEPSQTSDYTFTARSNDGARIWIDDKIVIDAWEGHSDRDDVGKIHLEGGKRYHIKIEYFQAGGTATMRLLWANQGGKAQLIPQSAFYTGNGDEHGLAATYFAGAKLEQPKLNRTDGMIDFQWKDQSPFTLAAQTNLKTLALELPAGKYTATFLDPVSGKILKTETLNHNGGVKSISLPNYQEELAIGIKRAS